MIQPAGTDDIYHADWMLAPGIECEDAVVEEITAEEYEKLVEDLATGAVALEQIIEDQEPPAADPEDTAPAKDDRMTLADILEIITDQEMRITLLEMGVNVNDL